MGFQFDCQEQLLFRVGVEIKCLKILPLAFLPSYFPYLVCSHLTLSYCVLSLGRSVAADFSSRAGASDSTDSRVVLVSFIV